MRDVSPLPIASRLDHDHAPAGFLQQERGGESRDARRPRRPRRSRWRSASPETAGASATVSVQSDLNSWAPAPKAATRVPLDRFLRHTRACRNRVPRGSARRGPRSFAREALRQGAANCGREVRRLSALRGRHQTVFGEGPAQARVMLVGERLDRASGTSRRGEAFLFRRASRQGAAAQASSAR